VIDEKRVAALSLAARIAVLAEQLDQCIDDLGKLTGLPLREAVNVANAKQREAKQ